MANPLDQFVNKGVPKFDIKLPALPKLGEFAKKNGLMAGLAKFDELLEQWRQNVERILQEAHSTSTEEVTAPDVAVSAVNTGQPGTKATVSATVSGTTINFTFTIPKGEKGDPGPPGITVVTAPQAVPQLCPYSGGDPNSDGVVPSNPTKPAIAYKFDGTGQIYGWDTVNRIWA